MNNTINFLKRYYKCTFDFTLFKSYLKEPMYKALLFLLPLFLIFTFQSYFSAISTPNEILDQVDGYYEHVQQINNADIKSGPLTNGDAAIQAVFQNGEIELDQNKIYDNTFTYKGKALRLIIDTENTRALEYNITNEYASKEKDSLGYKTAYMSTYIGKDFVIINMDDLIYTYSLNEFDGTQDSISGMFAFVKDNYVAHGQYLILASLISLILYLMYYLVDYFIVKSFIKRKDFKISKINLRKIVFYSMQPGMYVYLALNLLNQLLPFDIGLVIPLLSMLSMYYVATKTVNEMSDFFKREKRKVRKQTAKANG